MKIDIRKIGKTLTSPTAYKLYSIVGVVSSVVLTHLATKKASVEKSEEKLDKKELVKTYAPAVIATAATIVSINKLHTSARDALFAVNTAYKLSEDRWNRYKGIAGTAIAAEVVDGLKGKEPSEGKKWFFDEYSQRYFQSTDFDVITAAYHFNRNFTLRGSASLNEFYAFIDSPDLPELPELDQCGYNADEFYVDGIEPWIDINYKRITDDDGNEVTNISFVWSPDFYDYHLSWGYKNYIYS